MADGRDNTRALRGPAWKKLANLGDVQRGLASLIRRVNCGRLDPERAKPMISGLKVLGDMYTARLERRLASSADAAETVRQLRTLAEKQLESLAEDDAPEPN